MRVLIVANEAAGVRVVREVAKTAHEITAVMSFGEAEEIGSVGRVATYLGLKTLPGVRVKDPDFAAEVIADKVDVMINVHTQAIVCDNVLDAPTIGCFNLHPGPLPRYAGRNPVSWAIFNGETEHGVTVHKMVTKIDGGAVAYESFFPCDQGETGLSLMSKCVRHGVPLVMQLLADCADDPTKIPAIKQNAEQRRYYGAKIPNRGQLDVTDLARNVDRFVRACDFGPYPSPWGHPYLDVGDKRVSILSVRCTGESTNRTPGSVTVSPEHEVLLATANEWIVLEKVAVGGEDVPVRNVFPVKHS